MNKNETMLFAMPNSEEIGKKVAKKLNLPLAKVITTIFADGELMPQAEKPVRSKDVYIFSSLCRPANDNLMELLLFIDSLKRASAGSINVVISYYCYARQDRKAKGRQPIGARLVANLLERAGVTKIITVDLHNKSIQGFFDIPLDDLKGQYILAKEIKKSGKFTVVSPDHGGAVRARILAELISDSVQIAIVDKRRTGVNNSEILGVLGDVKNKNVVIIDDMIDTGGTIIKAAKAIKENGAKKILIAATHGIFSNGFEAFEEEETIDKVIVTDSIPLIHNIKSKKLKIVTISGFISDVISASINAQSVGSIYVKIRKEIL